MQVQSAADPPKKIALGERSIMMDGREDLANLLKDQGAPVEIIYPAEGSPMVIGPSGVFV
jgi:iron(III) transport system substrate-binding protein